MYTCTYCPMITMVNDSRLVAIGGCTPAGCPGCNGIHVSRSQTGGGGAGRGGDASLRNASGALGSGSTCGAGCIKHSDDGGKSWSQIRPFTRYSPGGMINYDRTSKTLLLQFPDSAGKFTPHPGAVLQMTSSDFGLSWTEPTDVSAMLGPVFSPGVSQAS